MRRSGTTILYDALLEDPALRCFYEPLREQRVTIGGGSGARETDAFAETRALREEFGRRRYPAVPIEEFNWGGPRDPDLELQPDLPEHCRDWLRFLLEQASEVAVKETRLHCKVPALAELDPDAVLVHVVRDPRAVATSMMLGRGLRHRDRYPSPDHFFTDRSERKLWSSRRISELLLGRPEHAHLDDPPDVIRVLLVWKLTTEEARQAGRRLFGERYLMLRNETLRADPQGALASLYGLWEHPLPKQVAAWAARNVRPAEEAFAAADPRWAEALRLIGAEEAAEAGGYGELLAAHPAGPPSAAFEARDRRPAARTWRGRASRLLAKRLSR
jgi:hypothetical protein